MQLHVVILAIGILIYVNRYDNDCHFITSLFSKETLVKLCLIYCMLIKRPVGFIDNDPSFGPFFFTWIEIQIGMAEPGYVRHSSPSNGNRTTPHHLYKPSK